MSGDQPPTTTHAPPGGEKACDDWRCHAAISSAVNERHLFIQPQAPQFDFLHSGVPRPAG